MAADRPVISVTSTASPRRSLPRSGDPTAIALQQPSGEASTTDTSEQLRAPSPAASCRLQVPRNGATAGSSSGCQPCCGDEADLIRVCGVLSRWLRLPRSFSTGDIGARPSAPAAVTLSGGAHQLPRATSELQVVAGDVTSGDAVGGVLDLSGTRLEGVSRSASTWVAVGDISSVSQLQSPQFRSQNTGTASVVSFTAADLVRSVNKKTRQNYIKRRLQVNLRATQLPSRSGFDLYQLLRDISADSTARLQQLFSQSTSSVAAAAAVTSGVAGGGEGGADSGVAQGDEVVIRGISVAEVDRERGKPLTRYQKNMLVFNWLQQTNPAESFQPT